MDFTGLSHGSDSVQREKQYSATSVGSAVKGIYYRAVLADNS